MSVSDARSSLRYHLTTLKNDIENFDDHKDNVSNSVTDFARAIEGHLATTPPPHDLNALISPDVDSTIFDQLFPQIKRKFLNDVHRNKLIVMGSNRLKLVNSETMELIATAEPFMVGEQQWNYLAGLDSVTYDNDYIYTLAGGVGNSVNDNKRLVRLNKNTLQVIDHRLTTILQSLYVFEESYGGYTSINGNPKQLTTFSKETHEVLIGPIGRENNNPNRACIKHNNGRYYHAMARQRVHEIDEAISPLRQASADASGRLIRSITEVNINQLAVTNNGITANQRWIGLINIEPNMNWVWRVQPGYVIQGITMGTDGYLYVAANGGYFHRRNLEDGSAVNTTDIPQAGYVRWGDDDYMYLGRSSNLEKYDPMDESLVELLDLGISISGIVII